jgi:hypothetical protein
LISREEHSSNTGFVPSKRRSTFDSFDGIEVVIGQDALTIPHIELLAAVSSPLLVANFQQGGGGG